MTSLLSDSAPFLLEMAFRGALLLAVAHAAAFLLRAGSLAGRDALWTAVFAGLLALPATGALLPDVVLPASWLSVAGFEVPVAEVVEPTAAASPSQATPSRPDVAAPAGPNGPAANASPLVPGVLLVVWALGAALLLVRLALRHVRAAALVRAAAPLAHEGWTRDVARISRAPGVSPPFELRTTGRLRVPTVSGVLRSRLLLPVDAAGWSPERRRIVLLHELVHVRRRHVLAQLLADLACVLHWPNPLVWTARDRAAASREQACDDAVLAAGVAGVEYADEMLALARRVGGVGSVAPAGVSMAQPSSLERRLRDVLDPGRRRSAPGGWVRSGILLAVLGASWPLAAATFSSGAADAAPEEVLVDRLARAADPDARAHAAWMLGEAGAAGADGALRTALDDPSPDVRAQVAWAVGELGAASAGPELIDALDDGSPEVRHQAAWALGETGIAAAGPPLVDALDDRSPEVRRQAAWALGELGTPSARKALGRLAASDPTPAVREQAEVVLRSLPRPVSSDEPRP